MAESGLYAANARFRRRQLLCDGAVRGLAALLCLCAVLSLAADAQAEQPDALALHWRAPPPCPTQDSVRHTVSGWLAQSSEPTATNGIEVEAVVRRDARGFVLDLRMVTPGGRADEQLIAAGFDTLAGLHKTALC